MKSLLNFLKKNVFLILIFGVFIFLKSALMHNLLIIALTGASEDDALMVNLAKNIISGNWLGDYSYHTLMKGPIFPLFLVVIHNLRLSYICITTLFYTFSCILFMIAIRKIIKNKYIFLFTFIVLLFNPITMCTEIAQRVYRNVLTPGFSLIITGCYIAIFLRRNEKISTWIPWILIEAISLPLFYFSREDTIWIMPFIVFIIISIFIGILINKNKNILKIIVKSILLIIPVVLITVLGNIIALKNEEVYGKKVTNVLTDSNFSVAMKMIYAVNQKLRLIESICQWKR